MKLIDLKVRSLPGIPDGFNINELSEVNVISGPNGIGKTSLCHAVADCLWPGKITDSDSVDVEATWKQGNDIWIAKRRGNDLTWRRNGQPSSAGPPVPEKHLKDCFYLCIDDLLPVTRNSSTDGELAREIAREMSGGYDVNAVRDKLLLKRNQPGPCNQAKTTLRLEQQKQQSVSDEEQKLPALEDERKKSEEARQRRSRLDHAKNLADWRVEMEQCEQRLSRFPKDMAVLKADDKERMKEKAERIRDAENGVSQADKKITAASRAIEQCAFPNDKPLDDALLNVWQKLIETALTLEAQSPEFVRREKAAREDMGKAQQQLSAFNVPNIATITREDLRAATHELDTQLRHQCNRQAQEKLSASFWQCKQILASQLSPVTADQFRDGARTLSEWLSYPEPSTQAAQPVPAKRLILSTLLSAGLALAAGLFAFLFSHDVLGGIFAVFAAIAASSAYLFVKLVRTQAASPSPRRLTEQDMEAKLKRLNIPGPDEWSRLGVLIALEKLTDSRAKSLCDQNTLVWLDSRLQTIQMEMNTSMGTPEEQKRLRDLQQRTGLKLEWQNWQEVWVLCLLWEYQEKNLAWEDAKRDWEEEQAKRQDRLAEIERTLRDYRLKFASWLTEPISSLNEAKIQHEHLEDRNRALRNALKYLADAEDDRELSEKDRVSRCEDYETFLEGRKSSNQEDLLDRLSRLADWKTLIDEQNVLRQQIHGAEAILKDSPDIQQLTVDEVNLRITDTDKQIVHLEEIYQQIAEIKQKISAACDSKAVSEASEKVMREQAKLEQSRQQALHDTAGRWLLNQINQEHSQDRSTVFNQANELFQKFTNHTYSLKVAAQSGVPDFWALVVDDKSERKLSQLSAGTRVQLLMAVRVAFVQVHSAAASPLPLWLDEALAHSDPQRRQAITEMLCTLSAEGQQIFYLTNDPADVHRINDAFAKANRPTPNKVDMNAVRNKVAGWSHGVPVVYSTGEILPAPNGCSPEEYGRKIGVAKFDPNGIVESLPLYYLLLDDLPRLYRLLQVHLSTVGRWCQSGRVSRSKSGLSDEEMLELDGRVKVAEAFFHLWKEGRSPKLSDTHLKQWMPTWADRLWPVAERYPHDARSFLNHLQAPGLPGFGTGKQEKLHDYLEENGFLPEAPILSEQEIFLRLIDRSDMNTASLQIVQPWLWRLASADRME